MKIETIITKQESDSWLDVALRCLEEHKYMLESTLADCQGNEHTQQANDIERLETTISDLIEL
jgi:hypothetical protein